MVHPLVISVMFATARLNSKLPTRNAFPSGIIKGMSSRSTPTSLASNALPPLVDASGNTVEDNLLQDRLKGKRVAFYFAAGWCPMCTSFEPALMQFQQAAQESGKPIELIYVSSDRSTADALKRAKAMNKRLSVASEEETANLKKKYKIWAGSEAVKFGFGRRSGVPALVVLNKDGDEMTFVPAEAQGVKSLGAWPLNDETGIWV